MKRKMRIIPLLLTTVATTLFAGGPIEVCPNARNPTIQSGVNAAAPGDTIEVCPATYTEQVVIAKSNLTIEGTGAIVRQPATINLSYGFLVGAPGVRITGFQITGFKDHTLSAGIYVNGVGGTQIANNTIYGNCNGVILSGAVNTEIRESNISQNPFPDPSSLVPQRGIPEPAQTVPNSCVTQNFDQIGNPILGDDGFGIKTVAGRQNKIENDDVEQNGECGIQILNDSGGSSVSRNRLFGNTGPQISPCGNVDVRYSSGAAMRLEIAENSIDTGSNGIMLVNSDHIEIDKNTVTRMGIGINVMDSNWNEIDGNSVDGNFVRGIFLTGQYNEIGHNSANRNGESGIVLFVDGCNNPSAQVFLTTANNTIDHNSALGNGQIDAEDFSSLSGTPCTPSQALRLRPGAPPSGSYTPGTLDLWEHNNCNTSSPPGLCKS